MVLLHEPLNDLSGTSLEIALERMTLSERRMHKTSDSERIISKEWYSIPVEILVSEQHHFDQDCMSLVRLVSISVLMLLEICFIVRQVVILHDWLLDQQGGYLLLLDDFHLGLIPLFSLRQLTQSSVEQELSSPHLVTTRLVRLPMLQPVTSRQRMSKQP